MGLFNEKILISEEIFETVIIDLNNNNIPYKFSFVDVDPFINIKVRKKFFEQAKAIIYQHICEEEVQQQYQLAKKEKKKHNRKESLKYTVKALILFIITTALTFSKSEGIEIVAYFAFSALFLYAFYLIKKQIKELKEEEFLSFRIINLLFIFGYIGVMVYAVISILTI